MKHAPLLLALSATACECPPPWTEDTSCSRSDTIEMDVDAIGAAPWDGFRLEALDWACSTSPEDFEEGTPWLLDESGAEVGGLVQESTCERWRVPQGLEPGAYQLLGLQDVPSEWSGGHIELEFEEPVTLMVGSWGHDAAFDHASVTGRTYEIPLTGLTDCGALDVLLEQEPDPGAAYLELGDITGDRVQFRLLWGSGAGADPAMECMLLESDAGISATGELYWTSDHERVNVYPLVEAWNLTLRLGWDGSGEQLAGVEAAALAKLRDLAGLVGQSVDDACGHLGGRTLCPDGSFDCANVEVLGGTGTATDRSFGDELPSCWEDLDAEAFAGCELGCAAVDTRTGALSALFLATLLGIRRRRRDTR